MSTDNEARLRDELEALPIGTVVAIGHRFPSGNVQGSLYMRTTHGLRYVGPGRDDAFAASTNMRQAVMGSDAYKIQAVPADDIERLTAERDEGAALVKEGLDHIRRLMAERDRLAAERDRLREALVLMQGWCLDGDEPRAPGGGDLLAHVTALLGESPVPDEPTQTCCEWLPGTIGAETHCAHWHAADDPEFADDRASAACCWCGDHEDGSGSCPGPPISRFAWCAVPSHWVDEVIGGDHDGGLPEDPRVPCMTAADVVRLGELAAEAERLRHGPLRDDEPTRMTAGEVRQIMDEAEELSIRINGCDCPKPYDECEHDEPLLHVIERLEAETKRLGQLVAQHSARADYWTAQTRKAQEVLAVGGDGAYEHVSEMLHDALARVAELESAADMSGDLLAAPSHPTGEEQDR